MATGKRYYWMKLRESFMTSDIIDYFMAQQDGANYVVLYQMLCLKTINTGGRLSRQIGEIIIPFDVEKIQRDCKWFSTDTIRVALNLYRQVGLIYEDRDGTLVMVDHENLVGSETDYAEKNRRLRANQPSQIGDKTGHNVSTPVSENVATDIRDKSLDIRDRDKSINKGKKADAFSELAGDNSALLEALRDFEKMRKGIKKPLTDRAKAMLVTNLKKNFPPEQWIAILDQSIKNCWLDVYPLKSQRDVPQRPSAADDLRAVHAMFEAEGS